MVENSVGRIWIEHLRAVDPSTDEKVTAERFGWKYYLPEAEQEEAVNVKLAEIRTTYKDLKPTDITCIDKTTPRLIQFHTLKNAVNPPFLGGFSIFNTVVA